MGPFDQSNSVLPTPWGNSEEAQRLQVGPPALLTLTVPLEGYAEALPQLGPACRHSGAVTFAWWETARFAGS